MRDEARSGSVRYERALNQGIGMTVSALNAESCIIMNNVSAAAAVPKPPKPPKPPQSRQTKKWRSKNSKYLMSN